MINFTTILEHIGKRYKPEPKKRRKKPTAEKIENEKVKVKKTNKKMKRVQKLIDNWQQLSNKMKQFIINGRGTSLRARLAYAVLLMMETGIRTGNEKSAEGYVCNNKYIKEYGKKIQTYGVTTIQVDHTETNSTTVFLNFTGKKGVNNILDAKNPVLRKYYDDIVRGKSGEDRLLDITYKQLKKFVASSVGSKFTPKDIRTAAVNLKFIAQLLSLKSIKKTHKKGEARAVIKHLIEHTANEIGHTKGVCKGAYLSPSLLSYVEKKIYKPKEK